MTTQSNIIITREANIWITTWNFLTFFSQAYIVTTVQIVGYDWPTVNTLGNDGWLTWALKEHTSGASRMTQWTIIVWIYPTASGGVLKRASQDRTAKAGALSDIGILFDEVRLFVTLCALIFRLRFSDFLNVCFNKLSDLLSLIYVGKLISY